MNGEKERKGGRWMTDCNAMLNPLTCVSLSVEA